MPDRCLRTGAVDVAGHSTGQRLISAAERLFGEYGVGAVSLRAIMQEAQTSVTAVHYHFGSKRALLEAVLRSRLDQVNRERDQLLDPSADVSVHDLANAYVRPVVAVLDSGGQFWIRLVGQLVSTGDYEGLTTITESFFERNAVFVQLLERLSPGVATRTLHFRLAQAMGLTLNVLGDVGRTQRFLGSDKHPWNVEDVVSNLVDVVASIFVGPPEPRRRA